VGLIHREQVEGETLGRLGPDAGEPAQLVDETLDRAFEHQPKRPPRPPVRPPSRSAAAAAAFSIAWRIAATTRSSSISTSDGSTTSGEILISSTSWEPDTTAVTRPPPAEPS